MRPTPKVKVCPLIEAWTRDALALVAVAIWLVRAVVGVVVRLASLGVVAAAVARD